MVHYAAFFHLRSRNAQRSETRRCLQMPGAHRAGTPRRAVALLVAASAAAADPNKVLRISFPAAETGFDPVRISDLYSTTVNEAIFERLLTYDYLARPAKLVPMIAESMPEVVRQRPDLHRSS